MEVTIPNDFKELLELLNLYKVEYIMTRKTCALLVILVLVALGCRKQQPNERVPESSNSATAKQKDITPHFAACVTCYIGEIGSRSNCSTIIAQPNQKTAHVEIQHKLSCGHPDEVSDIEWKLIEHKDGKDLYSFKRTFPVNKDESTTTSTVVSFDGNQVIIFQDEYQVIVMDSPERES